MTNLYYAHPKVQGKNPDSRGFTRDFGGGCWTRISGGIMWLDFNWLVGGSRDLRARFICMAILFYDAIGKISSLVLLLMEATHILL